MSAGSNVLRCLFSIFISGSIAACSSAAPTSADVPALLVSPSAAEGEQLHKLLVEANYGAAVTVSEEAFTESSRLALEQGRLAGAPGQPLHGRDLGRPKIFRLVQNARGCWLIRDSDGQRWYLESVQCVPE